MDSRLDILRAEVDKLIMGKQPHNSGYFFVHLYGVSHFCTLLAMKRNLNAELAATCGMLHDIYQVTAGSCENHAAEGAKEARKLLKSINLYDDDEIAIITAAISKHSKKRKIHDPYDELLKDADVMQHCLYDIDAPVAEKEVLRYRNLLVELGIQL